MPGSSKSLVLSSNILALPIFIFFPLKSIKACFVADLKTSE